MAQSASAAVWGARLTREREESGAAARGACRQFKPNRGPRGAMSGSEASDDQAWEDWEDDAPQPPVPSLFAPAAKCKDAAEAWRDAARRGFDFFAFKAERRLDFYQCVRLVNYLRRSVADKLKGRSPPTLAVTGLPQEEVDEILSGLGAEAAFWSDDAYLQPVVPEDPLLAALAMDDGADAWSDDDAAGGAAAGAGGATASGAGDDAEDSDDMPEGVPLDEAGVPVVPESVAAAGGASAAEPLADTAALQARVKDLEAQLAAARRLVSEVVSGSVRDGATGGSGGAGGASDGADEEKGGPDNDTYYFNSYSHVGIHEEMLKDEVRTNSYRDAIVKNAEYIKGKVVLDIGCGTGILSMFAASAGASQVIGIDNSEVLEEARKIVKANGLQETVTLIRGKVEEIDLPIDQVDVIVSEWMGYALLYESMLDTVLHARDKWLTGGGLILPNIARMTIEAIDDKEYWDGKVAFWNDVYGYDMTTLRPLPLMEPIVEIVPPENVLSDRCTFKAIDINTVKAKELDFEAPFTVRTSRAGTCHGFVIAFDIDFDADLAPPKAEFAAADAPKKAEPWEKVTFSTGCQTTPTHWKQAICLLDPPMELEEGAEITGSINMYRDDTASRTYHVDIAMVTPVARFLPYHMA